MRLLDLFCGAGGAAMGYHRAGFTDIVGIDHLPQPHYPFEFVQADAIEYCKQRGAEFDIIHASPPCQRFSAMRVVWPDREHEDLLTPTRELLLELNKPYIIENVPGAPLVNPIMLCGTMFGLLVIRHRMFETNPPIYFVPAPCAHLRKVVKHGRRPNRKTQYHGVTGGFPDVEFAREAMDIDWMTQKELAQAIPPAYTEWLGKQLLGASEVWGNHPLPD